MTASGDNDNDGDTDRNSDSDRDSRSIGRHQQRHQRDEFRTAVRGLLMTPLMSPGHEDFVAVRRQSDDLRDWFARETGWTLLVEREGARLFKRGADLADPTRGLHGYDRRRYVLLCLACAVLERPDPQITLRLLGDRLLLLAADPALGFTFTLGVQHERRELVAVCRTLLDLGVLQLVEGDEQAFVQTQGDALYNVQRRALAGILAAVRGPSTWAVEDAPVTLDERLHGLTDEHVADSDEGHRTALRHQLARRLLDDPVVYIATLATEARAYFINQRGAMAARLCEATGLVPEQRAEGLALVDEASWLTDVEMPAEGTDAHVTLLVAEHLATGHRKQLLAADAAAVQTLVGFTRDDPAQALVGFAQQDAAHASTGFIQVHDIAAFLREAKDRYGRYWRKSAREPNAERELAAIAIDRLEKLQLIERSGDAVRPLPALARFALGEVDVRDSGAAHSAPTVSHRSLFGPQ
jgi:uncharacterized protein (TIGR02678 family)